jgi:hypothetical protein
MATQRPTSLPRRKVIAGGLAALAGGFAIAAPAEARAILARGMTGGGLAKLDGGTEPRLAHFSLFASAMQMPEGNTLFLGKIQWVEAASSLHLESTAITQCVALEERPDGAQIRGRMTMNGEGDYPFIIHAFDSALPGTGKDTLMLEVDGPLAREETEANSSSDDPVYATTATIVAGDFQWIIVDAELP